MWPFRKKETRQMELPPSNKKTHAKRIKFQGENTVTKRSKAADFLTYGLQAATNGNINGVLRTQLPSLRATSRALAMQNCYGRRYVQLAVDMVCGADGLFVKPNPVLKSGKTNIKLANQLEKAFYSWANNSKKFSNGKFTIDQFQTQCVRQFEIDGECFVILNDNGTVDFIDPIRLPSYYNMALPTGWISQSIEYDSTGQVVAYHIARFEPITNSITADYTRIPADKILHFYNRESINAERGLPAFVSVIQQLANYDEYTESTLIAKKIQSSSMGFITKSNSNDQPLDDEDDSYDYCDYFEPGTLKVLNPGDGITSMNMGVSAADSIDIFSAQILQNISAGLNVSKQILTGDSFSSFSSARLALILSRSVFKSRSNLLINQVLQPLYEWWLKRYMLNQGMSFLNYDDIAHVVIQLPKETSIDPYKDVKTAREQIEAGLVSRSHIIREMGLDPQAVFSEIQSEPVLINKEESKPENSKDANNENGTSNQPQTTTGDDTTETD